MQKQLNKIFTEAFDFCLQFENEYFTFLKNRKLKKRIRKSRIELCEALTIQIWFFFSGYKYFKTYYHNFVLTQLDDCFFLVSYSQFIRIINQTPFLLELFLEIKLKNNNDNCYFIDSTALKVCHYLRAKNSKVFCNKASFGHSSIHGQFFGFKLHLIVNSKGDIVSYAIDKANHHDSKFTVPLSKKLTGIICGDKAYICEKTRKYLAKNKLKLLTKTRNKMRYKNIFHGAEKHAMRHRNLIESVFNKLKNVFQISINRCRSFAGFGVRCLSALIAYTFDENKPKMPVYQPN